MGAHFGVPSVACLADPPHFPVPAEAREDGRLARQTTLATARRLWRACMRGAPSTWRSCGRRWPKTQASAASLTTFRSTASLRRICPGSRSTRTASSTSSPTPIPASASLSPIQRQKTSASGVETLLARFWYSRIILGRYINANYIAGPGGMAKAYIAAQGPMPATIVDFWRMVWAERVGVIVMNTGLVEGGVEKCVAYWPVDGTSGGNLVFGPFTITSVSVTRPRPEFRCTKLSVSRGSEPARIVTHLWWTDWPDKGVPRTCNGIGAFVQAARMARAEAATPTAPVVVHCSAGVGRTGCILAVDLGMRQADSTKMVDILGTVGHLRMDRGLTVQTYDQYRFIHRCLERHMEGTLLQDEEAPPTTSTAVAPPAVAGGSGLLKPPAAAAPGSSSPRQLRVPNVFTSAESPRAPQVGELVPHGQHQFKRKTFVRQTPCAVCAVPLQGTTLQGVRCSVCKRDAHDSCLPQIPHACELVSALSRGNLSSGLPSWPPPHP